ncbi:UbiH/UbiF/VisC/COQ6 family ubiquinone biosynthesis hydroxylase [Croceicoccus naphthovorans]|uniref:Ubiquinone biosynthesis protein UbiH n=1 Tax=Croceicoccus naphthovorans TaxID=1348774 RepID=A0A0G3XDR4_9SPHN|nr:UbiH/UbiF/VisC/COQ6 family ubiquinone biosynthesis hydroxylase [Croceicoccus naphthovorans]AKM09337.1 ubiquinone biosynthesis protein UbiH [Croceicoccus naphthovorans]MBB3990248.1 2-octaprenyl-6-methoxyphenol hydroxylase [Croceicoccus naphthovorans]
MAGVGEDRRDVVILGGGLVGMSLALALASKGVSSHVLDASDPATQTAAGFDGRASAVSTASWNLFGNIGVANRLEPFGCPIDSIAVSDQLKPGELHFRPEPDEGSLGRMFANRQLRIALNEAGVAEPLIAFHPNSRIVARERDEFGVAAIREDGARFTGSLLVAAEGRRSPTREEAGLSVAKWDYRHRALICGLVHEKPHGNVAWEIFYPAGPFALLPMLDDDRGRHRSALVWTVAEKDAPAWLKLGERAFVAEAQKRMGGILGEIELEGPRSSFPLGFHHAPTIIADRLALVGDAAHGIHPIAGQGLNLGLRDAAALAEVIADGMRLGLEPGDAQILKRYQDWRGLDDFTVALATDGLTWLFGVPGKTASAVRRAGMGAIERIAPLKRWFMDEARGVSGTLPALLQD